MFHYFKIPYFTCTLFTKFTYNEYIGPYFLSHVVLRFLPVNSPRPMPTQNPWVWVGMGMGMGTQCRAPHPSKRVGGSSMYQMDANGWRSSLLTHDWPFPSEVARSPWTPQTAGTVCASNKYNLPLSLRSGSLATSFRGGENKWHTWWRDRETSNIKMTKLYPNTTIILSMFPSTNRWE
jgi:hypothetical protein